MGARKTYGRQYKNTNANGLAENPNAEKNYLFREGDKSTRGIRIQDEIQVRKGGNRGH